MLMSSDYNASDDNNREIDHDAFAHLNLNEAAEVVPEESRVEIIELLVQPWLEMSMTVTIQRLLWTDGYQLWLWKNSQKNE